MGGKKRPRKVSDYETGFTFARGIGILREEVWMDEQKRVVRYNLAFIAPHLNSVDNGRILGYDNRHGCHERHFMGKVQEFAYEGFPSLSERFYKEVTAIRRNYEIKGLH